MKYKIVLVPFPFDDLSSSKVRPAVCLTGPIDAYNHVILAFITSRVPETLLESDLFIDHSDPDFPATGLKVSSTLQLHRLMTTATTLMVRELGELSPRMQSEARKRLRKLFELNS